MGSGASSVGTIKKKYKRLPPFTPGEIAKHGPNLIGTEVHLIGYIGLCEEKSKRYVVYSPFNRDEYGVYIKINVRKPLQGKTVKKTFTAKAGSCFTLCDGKGRDNVVISMENADDWQANLSVSNRHYNIECADHSRALLRAGGQFDGNRNGMIDRPDLKPFWVTFQNGNDPLYRLQTGADKMFGGRPRNALEYILHLNEKVSIVGVLEMDANTNQYILLPTKNTVKKGKTKIEKIVGITNLSSLSSALKEKSGDASQVASIDIDKDLIMVSMSEISEVKV